MNYANLMSMDGGKYASADVSRETLGELSVPVVEQVEIAAKYSGYIDRQKGEVERAAHRIAMLQAEIQEFYAHFHITRDLLELRNLVLVADLIVRSAQMRRESRGLHYSRDYPERAAPAAPTILVPSTPPVGPWRP